MIINGQALLNKAPIKDMLTTKARGINGVSHGLAEVGYDIRLKQDIRFSPRAEGGPMISMLKPETAMPIRHKGRFILASAIEKFQMPTGLAGIVHDKSTWARKGLSVFNTVIEPGWNGFLTLELVFNGEEDVHIPAGSGIAQVIFHQIIEQASYTGSYQDQADRPVPSKVR